jgi:hypothetical protein
MRRWRRNAGRSEAVLAAAAVAAWVGLALWAFGVLEFTGRHHAPMRWVHVGAAPGPGAQRTQFVSDEGCGSMARLVYGSVWTTTSWICGWPARMSSSR